MKPYRFSDTNATFKAPGCFDVPAVVIQEENKPDVIITGWIPSTADKIAIVQDLPIQYKVLGFFPPMNLFTANLQNEVNPDNVDLPEVTDEVQMIKDYLQILKSVARPNPENLSLSKTMKSFDEMMKEAIKSAIENVAAHEHFRKTVIL